MFKKMKVISVTPKAWASASEPSSRTVTAKEFATLPGSRLEILGHLIGEDGVTQKERTQIVMAASQLGPVKAAIFDKLKRGEGILETEFSNLRKIDEGMEKDYRYPHIDMVVTKDDGSIGFEFTPAPDPTWINVKEFGKVEASATLYYTTEEKIAQGKATLKEMINSAAKRG